MTVWAAFAGMGLLLAAYIAFLSSRTSWQFSPWLDGWLVVGFEFIGGLICVAGGVARPRRRRVAFVLGAGCLSWAAGDLVLTIESLGGATPSTPSLADPLYLAFFPLALVAIVVFTREETSRGDAANWLDGGIAALGMAAFCAAFAYRSLDNLVQGSSLTVATNLAYPVGDLLLLGFVAGSAIVVAGRSRTTLLLIAAGMAINAAGDTFNFLASSSGGSRLGTVMNAIAWPTSILLFAAAMWVGDRGSSRIAKRRLSGFVVPGLVTGSSLVILMVGTVYPFGGVAVGLAAGTLVLAGVRLAFRPALQLAREQLRSSEERYTLLFGQSPQSMLVYDRHTLEILAVSDTMIASYGYSRDEFYAMTIKDLQPAEQVQMLLEYLDARDLDGNAEIGSVRSPHAARHQLKDGTIIDVEITSNAVDFDGRECRIAVAHDVTERNKAASELLIARDDAVEASNMKSAFLANVSHEIRTPMNGVLGMNDLLLQTDLTAEQSEFARQVSRSGEQMLVLINDILDISKLEAGHVDLDIADFDLHETVEATCAVPAVTAARTGLELSVRIADDVPRRMRGDARRLHQVLLNMVSNAVKFTANGAVIVSVTASARGDRESLIRVEVADSGIGISAASLQRMFEPFTQADVSTTRKYGGTGLGLAIARELVELMGGTVGAESELGRGSTFWFELVLAASVDADGSQDRGTGAAGPPVWLTSPLVLIADDSPINQIVAARALERCGCRAEVVASGGEALAALQARRYDAVLMDCQMPGLDGYEATVELRRREGGTRRTPVIAMTAHAMDGDRQRCLDAGMDDYVTKPMRHDDLTGALLRWLPLKDGELSKSRTG
jgi:PAS domain S-box-containing protein